MAPFTNDACRSHTASQRKNEGRAAAGRRRPERESACHGHRRDRAVSLAAYLCRPRGSRRYVPPARECDGLSGQRLAVGLSATFGFRFGARAFSRSGGGLRVMGFRYAPGEAPQFTHGCSSLKRPRRASFDSVLLWCRDPSVSTVVLRTDRATALPFRDATAIPKKKSSFAELKRGSLCRSASLDTATCTVNGRQSGRACAIRSTFSAMTTVPPKKHIWCQIYDSRSFRGLHGAGPISGRVCFTLAGKFYAGQPVYRSIDAAL